MIEGNVPHPDNIFCLKWSNYQAHVLGVLAQLLEAGSLVDVTLCAANGERLSAHKIVLCAASSYFEEILASSDESHPIVIFNEVESKVLHSILDFVYHGELNVNASQLTEVLQVAATLQIRGLTEVSDQLPLLVHSDDTNSSSLLRTPTPCDADQNETLLLPQEEVSTEVDASLPCCDAVTQTLNVPSIEYKNSTSLKERHEQANSDCNSGFGEALNGPMHPDSFSKTSKDVCNIQNRNWTAHVTENVQACKKRKRRESCRKEYSEDQLAAALRDLRSGQFLGETSVAHNIPKSTLYVRARAEGIPITVTRQEHSGENVNAAVQAVNRGASLQQASEIYQIPKTVLWRRVKAAGSGVGHVRQKRQAYAPLHWQAAVQALQDGQNLSRISSQFQIPKTTLFREKVRLVQAGKLPRISCKKKAPQILLKQSQLKEAVSACKEGRMSQAEASITYQIPKTTIWRRLHNGTSKNSENLDAVRSVEITDAVAADQGAVTRTFQEQTQFAFTEGNSQLPVTYIVEEDFSTASLIL